MAKVTKKVVIARLGIGTLLLIGLGIAGLFFPSSRDDARRFTRIAEKRIDSVVAIRVVQEEGTVSGAGVIISDRGHILTAAHLFDNSTDPVFVVRHSGPIAKAEILSVKHEDDIAIIRIEGYTPHFSPLAKFGSLEIGQEVVAIGHPLSLTWTVTHGIISQLRKSNAYIQFMQTDVALNPGNSGGPVYNLNGEVIGIASHVYLVHMMGSPSGLNMAVSIDAIHKFLYKFQGL